MRVIPGDGFGDDRGDADGALLRLANAVAAAGGDADVLRIAVEGMQPLLEATCAAIVLSPKDGSLDVAACAGECGDFAARLREKRVALSSDALAADAVLTGSYAVEREPFSPEQHSLVDLFPGRESVRAVAAVPIHSAEGTVGVFLLFSDRDTAFGSRRMESVRTFATIVALEVHRRRRLSALLGERAEASAMADVVKRLSRARDEGALLADALAHCRKAASAAFAIAWTRRANLFEAVAIDGDDLGFALAAKIDADAASPLGQGPEGRAVRTHAIETVKDTHADRSYAPWLDAARASRVRSIAALPLASDDGDPVVIGLYSPDVDAFDAAALAHLAAYADHARIALASVRGFDRALREARERSIHAASSAAITRSLELGEVARSIARAAAEATDALFAVTYIGDRDLMSIAGGWNAPPNLALAGSLQITDQSLGAYPPLVAARERRIVVFDDVATDPQWLRHGWDQQAHFHGFRSVVAAPLLGARQPGAVVLFFADRARVDDVAAAALSRIGNEGGAAVESARRYERARAARDFLNRVLEESTDAIVQIDLQGAVTEWNSGAERMYGLTRDEAIGSRFVDLPIVPPESRDEVRELFSRVARGEQMRAVEVTCRNKDQAPAELLLSATPSRDEDGNIVGIVAFSKDITEQKKQYGKLLEQNRRLSMIRDITRAFGREVGLAAVAQIGLEKLLEALRLGAGRIYLLDERDARLVNVAQKGFTAEGCEAIGVGPATTGAEGGLSTAVFYRQTLVFNEIDGESLDRPFLAERSASDVSCVLTKPLAIGDRVIGALQAIGFDGRRLSFDDQGLIHAIADELAAAMRGAIALEDASRMAITDPLTGLYNYRFAHDFLKKRLSEARRRRRPFSVIMADIDGLQHINERFGRAVGDEVLGAFGRSLASCVRLSDVVARYGADEFIVLLPETQLGDALMLAERMTQAFVSHEWEKPLEDVEMTASMGCAAFPESGSHAQMLLKAADAALFQAKKSGKNAIYPRIDSLPRFAG